MTIYKTVDKSIASLCKNSINGEISIGEFQTLDKIFPKEICFLKD